jgi:hypothetical protein
MILKQISPIASGQTSGAGIPGRLRGQGKGIRIRGYETFRIFITSRSRLPDPSVGQKVGRNGYSRTDEAAEGMNKPDSHV